MFVQCVSVCFFVCVRDFQIENKIPRAERRPAYTDDVALGRNDKDECDDEDVPKFGH